MIKDIQSLTWNQTLGVIFGFLSSLSPGFLTLYLFKPDLVSNLDTFKIVIFSLALSLPIVVLNMALTFNLPPEDESESEFETALRSLFVTSVVFYPSILMAYIFKYNFKEFLSVLLLIQILIYIGSVIMAKFEKNKKNA